MKRSILLIGLLASTIACESSSDGEASASGGALPGTGGQGGASTGGRPTGGAPATGGTVGGAVTGGTASGASNSGGAAPTGGVPPSGGTAAGGTPSGGTAGVVAGSGGQDVESGGSGGAGAGGQTGVAGQAGGQAGAAGGSGGSSSSCVGKAWPTADPTKAGPFQVVADKNVGPLAGVVPDPIYGEEQQRFSVYRPNNLAESGYCHPILIWANG
jgi:hypothetical protein